MAKTLTIFALGSRGDVQPYVALGSGLHQAGYRVRIATFESFRALVEGQGLELHPISGDAQAILQMAANNQMLNTRNPLQSMQAIMRSYGAIVDDYMRAFGSISALSDSAAILNQLPAGLFGIDLAQKLHIPHITLSVIPLIPTSQWPNPLLAAQSLGSFNRLSYTFAAQLLWLFFRPHIQRFRRQIGLNTAAPRWLSASPKGLVINGFSPRVVPPPPDWGEQVHTVGYWQLKESSWQPDPELLHFLETGPKPVFIGFGSMIAPDPAALTRTVIEAIQHSGQRAILSGGWGQLGNIELPPTIYRIDYVPYAWLFPRMAAIIHHGGSGTTGLALHSGVPSMVVAFAADQPYWGQRLAALNVGLPPLLIKRLTAADLARAIRILVTDANLQEAAARLGEQLHQEHGIETAIQIIQHTISRA